MISQFASPNDYHYQSLNSYRCGSFTSGWPLHLRCRHSSINTRHPPAEDKDPAMWAWCWGLGRKPCALGPSITLLWCSHFARVRLTASRRQWAPSVCEQGRQSLWMGYRCSPTVNNKSFFFLISILTADFRCIDPNFILQGENLEDLTLNKIIFKKCSLGLSYIKCMSVW